MNAPIRVGVSRAGSAGPRADQNGQATVETAALLLLVMIMILVMVQAAFVLRDKVAIMHLARDAAREASVGTSHERIATIVHRADPDARVRITGGEKVGSPVTVEVKAEISTWLPIVGPLLPDIAVSERVTMRAER